MRKYLKWIFIGIIFLLVIVAVFPFIIGDMETLELNDAVHASMPDHSFVRLSDGYTHFEWGGPENGQPVVLVCGSLTPMFNWDYEFKALADAGFHVLRYDLFGRGLSDRPEYRADLFDRQLLELLDALDIKTPADIVGRSMGGALTIRFIDSHPDRVRKFALLAPAGFPTQFPLINRIVCWPLIGEWLMKAIGDRVIPSVASGGIKDQKVAQEYMQKLQQQMKYKGFKRSLLASMRDSSFFELEHVYKRVGKSSKSGILFWGTEDQTLPFEQHILVQAAIPSIEFHAIDGEGHDISPEKVSLLLVEFLKR